MNRLKTLMVIASIAWMGTLHAQLTIMVDAVPTNTPSQDPIHIAGNFQGWNPGSANHILKQDSLSGAYMITLPAGLGTIEFKFTRGNWSKVESNAAGGVRPNRVAVASAQDTLRVQIAGWEDLNGSGTNPSTATPQVSVLTDSFYMSGLDRYRRVWIYLPPDYHTSYKRYPVLYMHDGQNVFDASTSFAGEWQVDETLDALHAQGDPGIIVVAVDNGQSLRTQEYTPWTHARYGGGEGATYIDFIVNELKPYIDSTYWTLSGREHTGIAGSSLGGLISTFGGIKHQEVFSKVGAFSPAYWINPEIYAHVTTNGRRAPMRIFQIAGTLEGKEYIELMFAMEDALEIVGFSPHEINTVEVADGQHSEWFWAREFEEVYLWLFHDYLTQYEAVPFPPRARLYPNPAKDVITLEFSLKQAGQVSIEMSDIKGQQTHMVYERSLGNGSHQLQLDLSEWQLTSGQYLCRIQAGKDTTVVPFMVVN